MARTEFTLRVLMQAKLRLEMETERLRQTHSKEIESKDDEVEEIRQSCSKKVRRFPSSWRYCISTLGFR